MMKKHLTFYINEQVVDMNIQLLKSKLAIELKPRLY